MRKRKMSVIVFLFLLGVFWERPTSASNCQISKIAGNSSANAASLSWSLGDCVSKVDYVSVEVNHTSWLACFNSSYDRSEGSGHQVFNVSYTRIDISRLYPYSTYLAVLKAIKGDSVLGEGQVEFTTESDVPDSKPKPKLKGESDTYRHTIRFFWDDPSSEDCMYQNGRKDGYWVELRGLDPWVTEPLIIKNQSVTANEFYVGDLMPYTSYKLRVYSKNVGDLINQNVYLELQERTKPGIPSRPVNLTSTTISESSIYLSWKPAYPATGLIQEYRVRQGVYLPGGDVAWSTEISVDTGHHTACTSFNRIEGYVCYVVNDLRPATIYVFQVQTVNKDIESPSDWSERTTSETASPTIVTVLPSGVEEKTTSTSIIHHEETGNNTALVIVLCLVVAAVILGIVSAFLVYKFKLDKLKERLRLEQSISLSRLESSYGPGSISTQGTNYTVSPLSIQSRRLPEPPPHHVSSQPFDYQGYLDMSTPSRRSSKSARSANNQIQVDSEDMDGYLKPTFPQTDMISPEIGEDRFSTIPTQSYGTTTNSSQQHWEPNPDVTNVRPDLLPPGNVDRSSPASLNSSNSHHQLIISKSVDI